MECICISSIKTPPLNSESADLQVQRSAFLTVQDLTDMQVQQNTSPMSPPVPQHEASFMQGIETPSPADNLG